VALYRQKLRRVRNPVGWMLTNDLMAYDAGGFAGEYRTALEETRELLTKRLSA
jgi:hypothetical protein